MNLLFELRETAKYCVKPDYRQALQTAADSVQGALAALHESPTRENAVRFNGEWAAAERVLKHAPPMAEDPNSVGGAMREERAAA